MTTTPEAPGSAGLSPAWLFCSVLVVVAAVYLPTLQFAFVYDDAWTLVDNGFLRTPDLMRTLEAGAVKYGIPDIFRPTSLLLDLVSYRLLGLSAPAHHLLSVVLHLGCCASIWPWLVRSGASPRAAALSMLAFGTLAVHAEAVSVVSFREDLAATLLALAVLYIATVHTRPSQKPVFGAAMLVLVLTALACMAKMSAAPLPALIALTVTLRPFCRNTSDDPIDGGRSALLIAACSVGVAVAMGQDLLVMGTLSPYGTGERVAALAARYPDMGPQSLDIHLGYLQRILLPVGLSPEYAPQPVTMRDLEPWLMTGILVTSLGYAIWVGLRVVRGRTPGPRRRLWAWVILATVVLALPTSHLVKLTNLGADRFVYFTTLPLSCAWGIEFGALVDRHLHKRSRMSAPLIAALALPIIAQGSLAMAASSRYANDATLWFHAAQRAPTSPRSQAMWGLTLLRRELNDRVGYRERLLEAHVGGHCSNARRHDPAGLEPLVHVCEARLAVALRRWRVADRAFRRAYELSQHRRDRFLAPLIQISLDLPDLDEGARLQRAHTQLDAALREYPYSSSLEWAAARVFHALGDHEAADRHYRRARLLRPERWQAALSRLELALDLGDAPAAQQAWQEIRGDAELADHAHRAGSAARYRDASAIWPNRFEGVSSRSRSSTQ